MKEVKRGVEEWVYRNIESQRISARSKLILILGRVFTNTPGCLTPQRQGFLYLSLFFSISLSARSLIPFNFKITDFSAFDLTLTWW
jgi:hypothetical protein